jgi:uncharacterized protein (DUF58 family)
VIPKELLAALRVIEIHTARLANEQLSGTYSSSFKGQGLAFREVRPYQPGDDVRAIDWNVSARMNDAFVKVFVEEREMTVMLVVDLSASERFGTRRAPKTRVASEVAALLAFSAIRNNDRVGLIVATDKVERIVPPKKGEKHVMRVVREILGFEPTARPATSVGRSPSADREGSHSQLGAAGRVSQLGPVGVAQLGAAGRVSQLGPVGVAQLGAAGRVPQLGPAGVAQLGAGGRAAQLGAATNLKAALEALAHVSRRRSIAFVVSDFYDTGYERALALASAKHDVIPVVLIDPRDRALPDVGLATFEDLESGESIVVDTGDPAVLAWYAGAMKKIAESQRAIFHKLGLDSVQIETSGSFVRPLRDLFARRARRIRR